MACRDSLEVDNRLRRNQEQFIDGHPEFASYLLRVYRPYFDDYLGAHEEARLHHADPHEKRALRMQGFSEVEEGVFDISTGLGLRSINYKVKKGEYAKPGKKPRAIGDLGVVASLLGFRLTNFCKTAQASEVIEFGAWKAQFIKSPTRDQMQNAFQQLIEPEGQAYFAYFSDDSCLSVRHPGGVHRYNLDIKSCDCSHTDRLFQLLEEIVPEGLPRDDMRRLTAQCGLPIDLRCLENPSKKVRLQARCRVLYSGSTLTTFMNNVACLLILYALFLRGYTGQLVNGQSIELREAAASVGYQITGIEPLPEIEDLQFLKHSPILDESTNQYAPVLNIGVLLRSLGRANGDCVGRGDLRTRARGFCSAVVQSAYPTTDFPLKSSLLTAFGATFTQRQLIEAKNSFGDHKVDPSLTLPTIRPLAASLARRYRLTEDDMEELSALSSQLDLGRFINLQSVHRILETDYGIGTVEFTNPNYVNAH